MLARVAAVATALVLLVGVATACQPEPTPTPSGPVFASEEEAFAAAEETYRAYVDALNQRRADDASSPDPQSFLTGQALEVDIDTQRQLEQSGLSLTGATSVTVLNLVSADPEPGSVRLDVCLDSSATRVLNDAGQDVTPDDRQSISLLAVEFLSSSTGLLIESSTTKTVGEC
jgi:hypothetical protein